VCANYAFSLYHFAASGQIMGDRAEAAFPFRFRPGDAVPLLYTTAVVDAGGTWLTPSSTPSLTENLNFDLNFQVIPIVNRGNCKLSLCKTVI